MDTQLTVADIANIKTLLEAACARGAFRANEMSQVGTIYDKVDRFLQQASQQSQQSDTPTQGEPNA
jgi:hypothetical protein